MATATARKLNLFVPIFKVDEEQRLVYGRITQEVVDFADEILDYDGSKSYFQSWSDKIAKDSGGKSLGNVRVMHQPKVGGVLKDLIFNDAEKAIDTVAKIIDDAEWAKVLEGGYTGFSMGGRYVKQWDDPDKAGVTRFIAEPIEVSIVDAPCVPTAVFSMVKANGATEVRKFAPWKPSEQDVIGEAAVIANKAGNAANWPSLLKEAAASLVAKRAHGEVQTPAVEKGSASLDVMCGVRQVWKAPDGRTFARKADAHHHVLSKLDPVERALARAKAVMSGSEDNGFPTDTPLDIRASWSRLHSKAAKSIDAADLELAKAKIVSAWKASIDAAGPSAVTISVAHLPKALKKIASCKSVKHFAKGLWTVASLAAFMEEFGWLQAGIAWEEQSESDDGSPLPSMSANVLSAMGALLIQMAQEEVAELLATLPDLDLAGELNELESGVADVDGDGEIVIVEAARAILDAVKADTALMAKIGARNSKSDMEKIQAIHDAVSGLGAKCAKSEDDDETDDEGDDEEDDDDAEDDNSDGDDSDEGDDDGNDDDGEGDDEDDDEDKSKDAKAKAKSQGKKPSKLARARTTIAKQRKQIDRLVKGLDELTKDVATLKAAPQPPAARTHVVDKEADSRPGAMLGKTADELKAEFDALTPEQRAMAMIKLGQQQPIPVLQRGGPVKR